jgi:hypothetical protein
VRRLLRLAARQGMRQGWRRGVLGGNRTWIVVGGMALVGHLAGRALTRDEETVVREQLFPGESVRITHLPRS